MTSSGVICPRIRGSATPGSRPDHAIRSMTTSRGSGNWSSSSGTWRIEEVPFVGVCFGHQLIAKALGGTVVKSDRGWGVGAKEVQVKGDLGLGSSYTVLTSYQDQIEELPPGAEILGWNEHCPVSMIGVGENMVGFQGHPEFEPAYSEALMESRRGTLIPETTVEDGLASLEGGTDGGLLVNWILERFSSDVNRSV